MKWFTFWMVFSMWLNFVFVSWFCSGFATGDDVKYIKEAIGRIEARQCGK